MWMEVDVGRCGEQNDYSVENLPSWLCQVGNEILTLEELL